MNKEKYLEKIKKLLNLARKTTNTNEAASAIRQAQNLMREHGISENDARFSDIVESDSKGAPSDASKPPRYFHLLVNAICRAFGVEGYIGIRYTARRGIPHRCATFYGPESRPQVASYAFDVLSRQLVKARSEYIGTLQKRIKAITRTARADHFCEAWVQGVWSVLTNFQVNEEEAKLIADYGKSLGESKGLITGKSREPGNARGGECNASRAGFIAGKNASLNHAVSGSSEPVMAIAGDKP